MMTWTWRFVAFLFLLLSLAGESASESSIAGQAAPPTGRLAVETASGSVLRFDVEIAQTPEQRSRGLMFRRHLGHDKGMLFLYEREQVLSMWMKNTFIPLDMLFMNGNGVIVSIRENASPQSLDIISSKLPAKAVLEVSAGTVRRLTIKVGDRVRYWLSGE